MGPMLPPTGVGLYYKSFMIIIYDCNDNGLYYKTMIVANLALARSVNYDCKVTAKCSSIPLQS
jgi:hypothetical protein